MSQKIKCEYCDGSVTKVKGVLPFKSKALGAVNVPDIEQHKCSKCGNTVISLDEADKVTAFIKNKEQEIINNLPACVFISLNQAAERLGITKQAFSKHPRIKRGFIYSITIDNKKYFYKRSVEAFKATKDGRVSLTYLSIINQIDVGVCAEKPIEIAYIPLSVFQQSFGEMAFKVIYSQQSNKPLEVDTNFDDDLFISSTFYKQQPNYISCDSTH
jgi:hypothetical protein